MTARPDSVDARILQTLHPSLPGLQCLIVFGSRARGDARADSDLDVAFLADPEPDALTRFDLAQQLAARIDLDVDLVDLKRVSDVMRMQIVSTGRVLFDDGRIETAEFLDRVYADYARLNEERAGILHDVRRRGSVHG
jgi:predicted nucleotidyltransferase